jgi:hypothetical protein
MEIPVCSTIFLQGVFFSQIRTLEERMMEENIAHHEEVTADSTADSTALTNRIADIRITRFRNKKQWAEAYKDTTLKCWYCGLSFKGIPSFIPRQIRSTTRGKEYDTMGLFCGFACAFSFLKSQAEFVKDKSYLDKLTMLKMLFTQFYNKRITEFKEAPYIYDLASYGGHIDIVEYRTALRVINTAIIADAQPM